MSVCTTVANYDWQNKDSSGNRKYKKLTKPQQLPNHKLYDSANKNQREDYYYYSLILLFIPFRDESSLLLENETAEKAFGDFQVSYLIIGMWIGAPSPSPPFCIIVYNHLTAL